MKIKARMKHAFKSLVDFAIILIGSKGTAFANIGAISAEKANGESLKDSWPEYESTETSAKAIREAIAQGKLLGKSSPTLAPFDRRRFLSERKENAPAAFLLKTALKRGIVKEQTFIAKQGDKVETIKAYVSNKFDPAGKLSGKGATDNGCQFIAVLGAPFGLQSGFIETRSICDGRNESLLVKLSIPKTEKPSKKKAAK